MASKQDVVTQFENLLEQYQKKLLTLYLTNPYVVLVSSITKHDDYADVRVEDYNALIKLTTALATQKIAMLLNLDNLEIYVPAYRLLILFRPKDLRELLFKLPADLHDKYSHLI